MNRMYFKDILIVDVQQQKAKLAHFQAGLNVVTSKENHVGKSSLAKSLYYSLGAEIEYDGTWDKIGKLYVSRICVNDVEFTIARYQKKFIILRENTLLYACQSISKELAPALEQIFGFSVYLPGKQTKKHQLAPPVFTYLPYYIDQDSGWGNEPYESFSSLDQFRKEDRIKSLYYHLNVYTKHSIDIQAKIDENKDRITTIEVNIQRLKTGLEMLLPEIQNLVPAANKEELELGLALPKEEIKNLVSKIGESRDRIHMLQSTVAQHKRQLTVIQEYQELKKDETPFDLSNAMCPRCGYELTDTLYSLIRKKYNEQNEEFMAQQIKIVTGNINIKLETEKQVYVDLMYKLRQTEESISKVHDTYDTYVKQRGLADTIRNLNVQISELLTEKEEREEELKLLKKQLKDLPNKKEIDEKYIDDTRALIIKLGAWDKEYDGKIGLLRPLKGQGTLASKIILSQYIALFSTMDSFGNQNMRFPFVVDSPRSKEPSKSSSEEIINLILGISSLPQIILVTMDFDDFDIENKALINIIRLKDNHALLNSLDYSNNKDQIDEFIAIFNSMK